MKAFTAMKNRMAPNSGTLFSYDTVVVADSPTQDIPVPRPDEPNVYDFPTTLVPTYGALPVLAKVAVALLSAWMAAASTFQGNMLWMRPLVAIAQNHREKRKLVVFLLKAIVYFLVSNFALQEVFTPPSRISTNDLQNRYFLPSKLSNYEPVTLSDGQSLGVHFLQYDSPTGAPLPKFSALLMNHGFGASSLSWLPAIPKLADRLLVKRTLAHDAVGFGFTDRPIDVSQYTPRTSSDIGLALLKNKAANSTSLLLMGHSMGSLATLEMAARIPEDVAVTVILVAPALGMLPTTSTMDSSRVRTRNNRVSDLIYSCFVRPCVCYSLRRLVGVDGFWKKGLQSVWGDPRLVSDSDAQRFQWPSIGAGWEDGLLRFARAMKSVSDKDLVRRVASRPNTRIVVILGSHDKVVPRKAVDNAFSEFPEIPILEVDGCGHDPFEEKIDVFIDLVEEVLTNVN
jgi:pimeloyl-ACP methyl ester carboxylesterase